MNVNLGIWPKLTKVVIFLLFLAGALGVCVWYLPTIRQNEQMRKEILRLDRDLKRGANEAPSLENSLKTKRTNGKFAKNPWDRSEIGRTAGPRILGLCQAGRDCDSL